MIATVTLNPAIDQFFEVEDLGASDSSRATRIMKFAAGKGINVSKVLTLLGASTRAYTLLGGIMGREYERLATLEGLKLHARWVKEDTRVNVTIYDLKTTHEIRILAPGPCATHTDACRLQKAALKARPKPFALVMSGSLPPGLEPGTYAEWVRAARRAGIRCLVDTAGQSLRLAVRARPWAIKPNHFELAELCGGRVRTERDIVRAALSVVDRGVEIVAVSMEKKGLLLASRSERPFFVRAPKVRIGSRVGAGDALVAGLVRGLELGKPVVEAARWAVGAGSARVAGIQGPLAPHVRRLAARSRVEWAQA